MLISRFVTVFLIPLNVVAAATGLLPISAWDSIYGTLFGYLLLFVPSQLYFWMTGKDGIGQGDLELLAFIGSCIGLVGCWFALLCGSIFGSLIGIGYLAFTKAGRTAKIPFGPFLALGAVIFVLFEHSINCALATYLLYYQ